MIVDTPEDTLRDAIESFIRQKTGAVRVTITSLHLMSGGAIQQNWSFDARLEGGSAPGILQAVLRTDAPSGVVISHGRAQEYALFRAAHEAGVRVPEPLWLGDAEVIGRPFFVMRRLGGTAAAHRLVRRAPLRGDGKPLAEQLGEELAKIHSIRPPRKDLSFLALPAQSAAHALIRRARDFLDEHPVPHPLLEWGLCWLEDNAPADTDRVLCHRDFRTGNYMVDEDRLTGILDWEFAGWSDPLEDIGWFCAKCWRFGNDVAEAGGIGLREDFYRGYERAGGKPIPRDQVRYWEIMAHLNWAIIAIQQAARHISGEERSLNLALTGHMVPGLEWEILTLTESRHA